MAKLNDTTTYPNTAPALSDHVPGTDVSNTGNDANGETVTFTMQGVMDLFEANMTVPTSVSTSYQLKPAEGAFADGDKTKLDAIEALADVTDATNIAAAVNGSTNKDTPVDADRVAIMDSAASNALKRVSWTNIKATLKSYFDTLYLGTVTASDIDAEASTDGYVLTSDGAGNAAWEAATGGGASALADLTDVDATVGSPSDGDIIVYRSAGSDWVLEAKPAGGSNPAAADITDATADGIALITSADANPFTDADETKLDGIEALADVTDMTNVIAALNGATLTEVSPAATDKILILEASDSFNLKNATWSDVTNAINSTNVLSALVTTSASAPASAPGAIGAEYIDTTTEYVYKAVDTAASSDWVHMIGGSPGSNGQLATWGSGGRIGAANTATAGTISEKVTPVSGDFFVIFDSADSSNFKKVDYDNLPGASGGDVSKVGTPVDGQIGVWTGDGTIEGDAALTFDTTDDTLVIAASGKLGFGAVDILSDSAGTTTLQNIDALDATTEATIEAAIDTLANLTSIQGNTVTLTGDLIRSGAHSLTLTTSGTTSVTLPTSGTLAVLGANTFTGTQDFNGQQVEAHLSKVVSSVSGTLTTTAHSGNVLVTSGNVTVPTTAGFNCILVAGGAHTVTFNGTTSAAMAAGDLMTVAVESGTVIHAVLTASANKVSFA